MGGHSRGGGFSKRLTTSPTPQINAGICENAGHLRCAQLGRPVRAILVAAVIAVVLHQPGVCCRLSLHSACTFLRTHFAKSQFDRFVASSDVLRQERGTAARRIRLGWILRRRFHAAPWDWFKRASTIRSAAWPSHLSGMAPGKEPCRPLARGSYWRLSS